MRDDMTFMANPYFSGLQLAPSVALAPFATPADQARATPTRPLGPVPEDDGFRPLAPADAMMFLGRDYDPARTYRRNRLTGEIEPMGGPPAANGVGQTTDTDERSPPPVSDRERLLRLGRGEPNHSPMPAERPVATEDADAVGRRDAAATMQAAAAKRGAAGGVDNFVRSAAQAASLGFGDEIAAAGDATVGPALDWALGKAGLGKTNTSAAPSWSERYRQNLENERVQNKAYADAHPGWDMTGRIVGGIAGTAATLPRALLATGAGWSGLGKATATGAGLGGAAGFGEGEGGLGARLDNAAKGAAMDAVMRSALYPAGLLAPRIGNAVMESGPGRYIAEKVVVPGFNVAAGAADRVAAALRPSPPAGMFANVAEKLRSGAPTQIVDNASARRFGNVVREGRDDATSAASTLDKLGPGAQLADINSVTQRYRQRLEALSKDRAPRDVDEAILAFPTSIADGLKRAFAGVARHERFGNDAVRDNTLQRITRGDWGDNAEFLDRMAAQLAGASRSPNHIQRGLGGWLVPQPRRQE